MNARLAASWEALKTAGLLLKAGAISLGQNWMLGLFSVAAAFAIWFAVEEVDNPRQEGFVPADAAQGIRVETLNVPNGLIAVEPQSVRVRVRAREDEIPLLEPADFRATVDLRGVDGPQSMTVRVDVTSLREDVRVLSVEPSEVQVVIVEAAVKELPVRIVTSGSLPEGFDLAIDSPTVDPAVVELSGPPDLVNSVARVEATVNLTGQRDEIVEIDAPLVARTESGNVVAVTLNPPRATITLKTEQINRRRVLPLDPRITGVPGPGFQVTGITYEPQSVGVTGPTSVIDSLTALTLEPIDVNNAIKDVVGTKQIVRVPNVTFDRQTVQVTVRIETTTCGGNALESCFTGACTVGPVFETETIPAGLQLEPGIRYTVPVVYLAAPTVDQALNCADLKASISFTGASAGVGSYTARVTGPASVTIVSVAPISIRLVSVQLP